MGSPETEASIIFIRHIKRLHDDVMDNLRLVVNKIDGTFDGAVLSDACKFFLHHKIQLAIDRCSALENAEACTEIQGIMANYLEILPNDKGQIASTVYSVCSLNDTHALLMSCVPSHVSVNLKLLSGGRFLIEPLEMLLVTVAKSMA